MVIIIARLVCWRVGFCISRKGGTGGGGTGEDRWSHLQSAVHMGPTLTLAV